MGRPTSKVDKVVVAGPLAPFAEGFQARLEELGYTPLSAVTSMRLMVHLSRWLGARGLAAGDLTGERSTYVSGERLAMPMRCRRAAWPCCSGCCAHRGC